MTEPQSDRTEPAEDGLAGAAFRPNSSERAFVVQFDPVGGVGSRLHGRIEVVASGEAMHFHSLKQLIGFMVGTLRTGAKP
jgi:hypothetical protein